MEIFLRDNKIHPQIQRSEQKEGTCMAVFRREGIQRDSHFIHACKVIILSMQRCIDMYGEAHI